MKTVRLRPGAQRRLALGHLWIFSNEIEGFDRTIPVGEDVRVEDADGRLRGCGTFNPASLIAVRLHAPGEERPLDRDLIRQRVRAAWEARQNWLGEEAQACRTVFGEADGLPGLVVDRYGEYLSVQVLTAAMERRTDDVLDALVEVHGAKGVVLRNDVASRSLEGLELEISVPVGQVPERVPFSLHGLHLEADLCGGQKTGFFFDQRENYPLLRTVAAGRDVLDAFCYSGAWGLHAARWGARRVTFLDGSAAALDLARANAERNGVIGAEFQAADGVAFLKGCVADQRRFGVVVLDPPAFAKNRKTVPRALKGYLNLNKWGLRCVEPGGYLVTCTCSHHVRPEVFTETVALAAREAGCQVRVLGQGRQAMDHPWVPSMPETVYLKALLLQVVPGAGPS